MASLKTFRSAFSGGEVTPELFGRIDDAKFQTGLAKCRNFVTKPQGPAENRAGFQFVHAVKDSTKKVRLIPFTYSTTQTMVLEVGAGYVRFHTNGATLLSGSPTAYNGATAYVIGDLCSSGGINYYCIAASTGNAPPNATYWYAMPATGEYEIPSPYAEADLFDIHYVQSADVLTLVHPGYAPRELRRYGATNWQLATISFASPIAAPGAPTVVASGHTADKYDYEYVVTSVASDGISESAASSSGTDAGNLFETGGIVTISWASVAGASRYNVYKLQGGLYGYIGQTAGLSIVDDNIAPDLSKTPPIYDNEFIASGIDSVPVTNGGTNYGTAYFGGEITAITVLDGGSGYSTPTLAVSDPTGSGATFTVNTAANVITSVTVNTQGSGYTNPTFLLHDPGHSGNLAELSATVNAASNVPTLAVTDATGVGAVLVPVVDAGVITGVTVSNPGYGYTAPSVSIDEAAGGANATFGTPVLTGAEYPAAVSYFEQRRCFAGTTNKPQNIWMTRSGTESDMSYSLPVKDDDRIAFRVAAREANTIRHIVPLSQLLLLTSAAEWRATSVNSDAITPSTISVRPQSYVGASNVQPVTINNTLIYGAARGGHVHELAYNWQASGFITGDLTLRAPHLFDSYNITDMAYQKAPFPVVWFISSSGYLLGLTYVPEQQIGAWHWHDTDGTFESCATVAEGAEDVLYVVVKRNINGADVRYIEKLHSRQFVNQEDAFFVDCGLTYDGAAATSITGLGHLEGETVSILADGAVHPQKVVTGGAITLDVAASVVQVGLPITADLQTLPMSAMLRDGSMAQGHAKNINKVWLRVYRSSGIFAGPTFDRLTEVKQRTTEVYGVPPALRSEEVSVNIGPAWGDSAQVCVRQTDPLPLTVVSLTAEVAFGG